MFVTNNEQLWERAWAINDQGKSYDAVFNREHDFGFRWFNESFGTNYRLTEMRAAIGRLQLTKLKLWNEQRTANAHRIIETLTRCSAVRAPSPPSNIGSG